MGIDGFVLEDKETLVSRELQQPRPAEGEVLVRVERAGICGSDIEYFRHFKCGAFVPKRPFVLGHEFAGIVTELGPGVAEPRIGVRVAIEPSIPCGECRYCKTGRYNLCDNMRFFGSASADPHLDGGFREFVPVPARNVFVLPEDLGATEGAVLEPLAVAVHAVRRARPVDDADVLITGGGTIGQLVGMVLYAFGAKSVTVSDPLVSRRRFAQEHGAAAVLDPTEEPPSQRARVEHGGGFDIVFEASGQEPAIVEGVKAVRKGGRYVQIGTVTKDVTVPANLIMVKEVDFLGTFRYNHDFPTAITLMTSGRVPATDIVTSTYPFAQLPEAFAETRNPEQLKIHVALGA